MLKSRWYLLVFSFMILGGTLVFRAADLQILPNSRLGDLQRKQFETVVNLQARRGLILDRDGKEMAISIPSHSLFADPKLIQGPRSTAKRLARVTRISWPQIYEKLKNRERRFTWIKRFMSEEEKNAILALGIRGVGFVEEPKRIYPNEQVLSQVLGFVGSEGRGLEGIEAEYEEILQGTHQQINLPRDARGRPLIVNGKIFTNRPDGANLHLTIDSDLQFALERELKGALAQYSAEGAVGVILDAQTSEVLAMASSPGYDLNQPGKAAPQLRKNRAVTDVFEPGSTMKTFVVAGALQNKLIKPGSKFFCENGKMKVGDRIIREADEDHHFGWLTAAEILAFSSNIGTTKIAFELGNEKMREVLTQFRFGQKTGIDLPGESKGILHNLPWRPHLQANISFGHGVATTPVQMAAAYAAIANGGYYRKPFVVKKVESNEGRFNSETTHAVGEKILDPEVAENLRFMLMAATSPGSTGELARIPGYQVGGKTGTAQKVDLKNGGYLKDSYVSSFAGFVPAHRPKFVIYVAIDNPQKTYYGSQVAAPVFSKIASYAVRKAGIPPVLLTKENLIAGKPAAKAKETASQKGESILARFIQQIQSEEEVVKSATPIESAELTAQNFEVMPDLRGKSLREAYRMTRGMKVRLSPRGKGLITNTVPLPGQAVPASRRVLIFLDED